MPSIIQLESYPSILRDLHFSCGKRNYSNEVVVAVEVAVEVDEEAFRFEGIGFRVGEEDAGERGVEEATTPSPADWLSPFSKGKLKGVGFGLTTTSRVEVALLPAWSTAVYITE